MSTWYFKLVRLSWQSKSSITKSNKYMYIVLNYFLVMRPRAITAINSSLTLPINFAYHASVNRVSIGSGTRLSSVRRYKQLPEPMLTYCQLGPWGQTWGNSNRNTKLFIHENAFETVVCEMAAILFRGGELFCTRTSVWANVVKDVCPLRG